jgi:hypothetical protein
MVLKAFSFAMKSTNDNPLGKKFQKKIQEVGIAQFASDFLAIRIEAVLNRAQNAGDPIPNAMSRRRHRICLPPANIDKLYFI